MITKYLLFIALAGYISCGAAFGQQFGSVKGKIMLDAGNQAAAGVSISASSSVMPKPRSTSSKKDGSYRLPLLLPGSYQLKFTSVAGIEQTIDIDVFLDQATVANLILTEIEKIAVYGSPIVKTGNSSLTNSIDLGVIRGLPVGQNYRDLMKLIPGVQYSQNSVLGPSAGGSGVDNRYGFDGVDISLPNFGNLASEPSTADVQSVSMDRGGAKAIGFNRSGGFSMNVVSKSGTNEFHGNVEYKIQHKNFVWDMQDGADYELNKRWLTTNLSGPLVADTLFFYASYYAPEEDKVNKKTAYGAVKDFNSERDEYFTKLTFAPTASWLFNASFRTSNRSENGVSVGEFDADSTSEGVTVKQNILSFDGAWIISDDTSLNFQLTRFELESQSAPDTLFAAVVPTLGQNLDINNLTQLGAFSVPELKAGATTAEDLAYNFGATPLIDKYGYRNQAGITTGGGLVGANSTINQQHFYRNSFSLSLDHEMALGDTYHIFHFGFKYAEGIEQLSRLSNGWGRLSYIGGVEQAPDTTPIYFRAATEQMSVHGSNLAGAAVPSIDSSNKSYDIEFNDSIEYGDFSYDVGFLLSKDVLFGQGLRKKSGSLSGFELAEGQKYKMYTTQWHDLIQPRLGLTWQYNAQSTVFGNFAVYNPAASSLARAASWARNTRKTINLDFDQNGNFIQASDRSGSSGKFFADNLTPRRIDEYTLGTGLALSNQLYLRGHVRYRKGSHFWEDMPNNARSAGDYGANGGVPAHLAKLGDYIDNLADVRNEIGGSSYVIAEVDGGYTKYLELSMEAQWQGDRSYLNFSYVWSQYTGNFDQDNTASATDANTFIGSSNYADGKGRYVWDNKDGTLRGDVPHIVKAYGFYTTDWQANIGAYVIYQSGQAWEKWDGSIYGYSSSTNRYAEPAGSRRSASHWQVDLNYTQDLTLFGSYVVQFRADLFNLLDSQTGYNKDPYAASSTFAQARNFYQSRRLQLSVNIGF
jgi:hypothetical protein